MRFPLSPFLGAIAALALVASSLSAQRTWVVSRAGGPGVDFTDLPPAVAAAAPGDRIEVQSDGSSTPYSATTVGIPLTILGTGPAPGVRVEQLTVSGVSAPGSVVLHSLYARILSITACSAGVHVEQYGGQGILVRDSAFVTISDAGLLAWSGSPLTIDGSTVVLARVDPQIAFDPCSAPCTVTNSRVVVHDTSISGGGRGSGPFCSGGCASPAIRATDSVFLVGSGSRLVGGASFGGWMGICNSRAPAISGTAVVTIDPNAFVDPLPGQYVSRTVPTIDAIASRGGDAAVAVRADPGVAVVLCVSLPRADPLQVPQLGPVFLDPQFLFVADGAIADAQGVARFSLPLGTSYPLGTPLAWQALRMTVGVQSLSEPGVSVVR